MPSTHQPGSKQSAIERQITTAPCGHILTNINVWSPDGKWIVYDVRSDPAGSVFDGSRIERVHVETGRVQILYESQRGAHCGVVSYNPVEEQVAFILGPENPTPDWSYAPNHRRGVIVDINHPGIAIPLDACDITPPFTPGALRGGSHVHIFDGQGRWVSFTYEDAVLSKFDRETSEHQINLRGIGVSAPDYLVQVSNTSPRNCDGTFFSVLVIRLHADPVPGSDEIKKASEEGWVGNAGYTRADGKRQKHALAFQGQVVTQKNETVSELFIVDLPEDLTAPGDGPLQGTPTHRPTPPAGCAQRRLTYSQDRKYPGLQGPRHWTRSSPDGSRIAFLMKDDAGIVQIYAVSPNGGPIAQITTNPWSVQSAFSWNPNGRQIACVIDNSLFVTEVETGASMRLMPRSPNESAPRPEACVFSPDGKSIAYVRAVEDRIGWHNQIFVVPV